MTSTYIIKMTVCFYPMKIENKHMRTYGEKYKIRDIIELKIIINKDIIDNVIRNILINECEMTVIGYNNYNSKYWCKKYTKNSCGLYFEIEVTYSESNLSHLKFFPLIGNDENIKIFMSCFNKCIMLYNTSALIKFYLEGTLV